MGCGKTEQPMLGEEGIAPAMMIGTPTATAKSETFSQDAAETHSNPTIEIGIRAVVTAVLEIREPTPKSSVHAGHDAFE